MGRHFDDHGFDHDGGACRGGTRAAIGVALAVEPDERLIQAFIEPRAGSPFPKRPVVSLFLRCLSSVLMAAISFARIAGMAHRFFALAAFFFLTQGRIGV
jgi:hypothetical protein